MVKHVAFIAALLVQFGILAWPPMEKSIIRETGRMITLRTGPVDPYDVMRGYYMTLGFEISRPPGFESEKGRAGERVYTLLQEGEDGVWNALSAGFEPPAELTENQVVIRGRIRPAFRQSLIDYGIEKYFVPEAVRSEIEKAIRGEGSRILVDVAVDSDGDSSVLRLHVGEEIYEY